MKGIKGKLILQILIIIGILTVSAVLFLFPEKIDNKYKHSYKNLKESQKTLVSLNGDVLTSERDISANLNRLKELEKEEKEMSKEKEKVRMGINKSDFNLDIPSLLIFLEQNAKANNVKLSIDYNEIVSTPSPGDSRMHHREDSRGNPGGNPGGNPYEEEEERGKDEGENSDEIEIEEKEKDKENNDKSDDESSDKSDANERKLTFIIPQIEGIDVTTVPINITGGYSSVRSYVKYLDEIGMIEPASVSLYSEGKEIVATVVLNVFHGEVD